MNRFKLKCLFYYCLKHTLGIERDESMQSMGDDGLERASVGRL